jgi:Sugar kinases, ribokinase family
MKTKSTVVGLGEILWDLLPQGKVLGGAPANFAYHANQLGAESYVVSAIGEDELGNEILSYLSAFDLNLKLNKVPHATGVVNVTLKEGIPEYEILQPVAWDFMTLTPEHETLAKRTDAVCFGSLAQRNEVSRKAITDFVKLVPENSLKIFDINLRQSFYSKELIEASLQLANVLKINDDELVVVAKMFGWEGDDEAVCRQIIKEYNLRLLAYTCGTKGSYLFTPEEQSFKETPIVEVKDTVGAGDSFTAAMTMGLLDGRPLSECHEMAVKISAFVCTNHGATPQYSNIIEELIGLV